MNKSFNGLGRLIRESLNKLIPFMPFDFAQESLVEAHAPIDDQRICLWYKLKANER